MVAGDQERVDAAAGEFRFAAAESVQHIFGAMTEANEGVESEEPGGPLDGVHGAEDAVQQFDILGRGFERDHVLVHALQEFFAFDEEVVDELWVLREFVVHVRH